MSPEPPHDEFDDMMESLGVADRLPGGRRKTDPPLPGFDPDYAPRAQFSPPKTALLLCAVSAVVTIGAGVLLWRALH